MAIYHGITGVRSLITGARTAIIEFPAPLVCRLNRFFVRIAAPNAAGDTVFDINVNGITVFGDPADRPKILAGETEAEVFTDIALTEGDMVSVDVDSAPLGGVSGTYVIVQMQDAPTVDQYITSVYQGALGRDPDGTELANAIDDLTDGCNASTALVATLVFLGNLFEDTEYTDLATTDGEYIEDLYNAILGRRSDPAGFAYWVSRLGALTRAEVLENFNGCNEHVNQRVAPWCPQTLTRSDAITLRGFDVSASTPDTADVLTFNGTGWVPAPAAGGLPPGGATDDVLTKLSGTDGDADWATPSGGGGPSYSRVDPDEPPASPHAMNDEFEAGTLDAQWHVETNAGASPVYQFNTPASWLGVGENIDGWNTWTQELATTGESFDIIAKVHLGHVNSGSIQAMGLVVGSYTSHPEWGEIGFFGLYQAADNSNVKLAGRRMSGLNLNNAFGPALDWSYTPSAYIRIKCATNSGTLQCFYSKDGQVWTYAGDAATSDGSPVARIGFTIKNNGISSALAYHRIDFFRRLA